MNRIKMLRKEKGISQLELAKALNVHQTAVSQWEMERTAPDMSVIVLLADFFSVSVDFILERTDIKTPAVEASLNPDEQIIIDRFRKLDPAKRAAIETLLE